MPGLCPPHHPAASTGGHQGGGRTCSPPTGPSSTGLAPGSLWSRTPSPPRPHPCPVLQETRLWVGSWLEACRQKNRGGGAQDSRGEEMGQEGAEEGAQGQPEEGVTGRREGAGRQCPHSVSLVEARATGPSLRRQPGTWAGCSGGRQSPPCLWVPGDLVNTCHVGYSWPCPAPRGGGHRELSLPHR